MYWKNLVFLITLKVPIFYCIDQDNLMLFFCVQSDFVITVYRGGSTFQILRSNNSLEIPKLILKLILWPNLFSGSMNDWFANFIEFETWKLIYFFNILLHFYVKKKLRLVLNSKNYSSHSPSKQTATQKQKKNCCQGLRQP